jgi:hypothetical protein
MLPDQLGCASVPEDDREMAAGPGDAVSRRESWTDLRIERRLGTDWKSVRQIAEMMRMPSAVVIPSIRRLAAAKRVLIYWDTTNDWARWIVRLPYGADARLPKIGSRIESLGR